MLPDAKKVVNLAFERREELKAMDISCDAVILFAKRHAALAREMAAKEARPERRPRAATPR